MGFGGVWARFPAVGLVAALGLGVGLFGWAGDNGLFWERSSRLNSRGAPILKDELFTMIDDCKVSIGTTLIFFF